MKKTKVFVDGHVFDGEFQGTRTFIKGLYTELAKIDDSIEIYIAAHNIDNLKKEFNVKNIFFINYSSNSRYKRLFYEIPKIIKKHKFDYAHFQYMSPISKGCKFIVTIHDLLFNDFPEDFPLMYRLQRNLFFRLSALRADILTTVSNYSKQRINKYYKINNENIYITSNAVEDKFFEEYRLEESKKYIEEKYNIENYVLYVSRIEPRKNHISLLKAYINLELWKKGINLVFIGKLSLNDPLLDNLFNSLEENIKSKIFFLENVSNEDLFEFYKATKLFVYPSKSEGFGIPPLEAAALKKETLCSDSTAMSDFTFFKDNLFAASDIKELEKKIEKCLYKSNTDLISISKEIEEKYSWKKSANELYKLISS